MKKLTLIAFLLAFAFGCERTQTVPNPETDAKLIVKDWQKNLDTPWQMAFAADGRIFFTERPGRVRVVKNGVLETWLDLTGIVENGESGLLGIALDPGFSVNGYVYIAYTYSTTEWKFVNKLVRCKEVNGKGVQDKILIDNVNGQLNHNGGPIKFGPDGKMYWTVGDGFDGAKAQDKSNLNGKILRLNADGSVPADNPFPNSFIWTFGHRNVQGLDWQPGTNTLFVTEHGPTGEGLTCCMDEINIIDKGKNYGWPTIRGTQTKEGLETPIWISGTNLTWAPAGATFVRNGKWKGSFIFVGLRGEALYRAVIDPANPKKILKVEEYMKQTYGRLRDVTQAPDGTFYICVSNKDGRGTPRAEDDKIIILSVE
jgi:aldose sugar dehydrogenase